MNLTVELLTDKRDPFHVVERRVMDCPLTAQDVLDITETARPKNWDGAEFKRLTIVLWSREQLLRAAAALEHYGARKVSP